MSDELVSLVSLPLSFFLIILFWTL